jgi:hypothetical protein
MNPWNRIPPPPPPNVPVHVANDVGSFGIAILKHGRLLHAAPGPTYGAPLDFSPTRWKHLEPKKEGPARA